MSIFERIVVVTRRTALEELVARFNTVSQARFYIEHMGLSFEGYQAEHDAYALSLSRLRALLPARVKTQFIERSFLPSYTFGEHDVVVTLGPDGLVVNTAKYLDGQPIVALNPDPSRIDGILNPLFVEEIAPALVAVRAHSARIAQVAMAVAQLNDGQELHAVNDLFVGPRSHGSARYRIQVGEQAEEQSSSGIIVSTGAGSTGWLRSIVRGSVGIAAALTGAELRMPEADGRFDWESDELRFFVREPFPSRSSSASLVFGRLESGDELVVTSWMPGHGVIFSDGIESDFLPFNSGSVATIRLADRRAHLVQRSW